MYIHFVFTSEVEEIRMNRDLFEWDHGNVAKVQKHGLKIFDIEEFILSDPIIFKDAPHSKDEIRFIAIGDFKNRLLFVVFVIRESIASNRIRVISARFSSKKEWFRYEKEIKKSKRF
jgi:uncharacterized protein